MSEIIKVNIEKIVPNKAQPRLDFDTESIKSLAESIKENGLLQPITVRKQGAKYELIAGERRYRACVYLKMKSIDAIVLEKDDDESAKLALIENIQREDLNAVEQALAMKRIMRQENITQDELAERLGYKQSTVANKLRLLKLPKYIKNAISKGTLSERHARALLKVPDEKLEDVFKTIVERKYTVSKTEEYINGIVNRKKNMGVTGNAQIAINTIKQAYDMCRKAGVDADYKTTDYADSVKITITVKKLGK